MRWRHVPRHRLERVHRAHSHYEVLVSPTWTRRICKRIIGLSRGRRTSDTAPDMPAKNIQADGDFGSPGPRPARENPPLAASRMRRWFPIECSSAVGDSNGGSSVTRSINVCSIRAASVPVDDVPVAADPLIAYSGVVCSSPPRRHNVVIGTAWYAAISPRSPPAGNEIPISSVSCLPGGVDTDCQRRRVRGCPMQAGSLVVEFRCGNPRQAFALILHRHAPQTEVLFQRRRFLSP